MSPDLLPTESVAPRVRLRFYELRFSALSKAHDRSLAPREGTFREAVVGFPARAKGVSGETSLFMWTDSDTYLAWGREAFGWPLLRGEISLNGSVWRTHLDLSSNGNCQLQCPAGSAIIDRIQLVGTLRTGSPAGLWLTPRRVLHRAGVGGEVREVLAIRPEVKRPGIRYEGSSRVRFDFATPHPLASLATFDAEVDVVDGFELVVGNDVELV